MSFVSCLRHDNAGNHGQTHNRYTFSFLVITDWNHEHILKLQGLDGRLFDLVAPLVMNRPYCGKIIITFSKTTRNHVWYIAMEAKGVGIHARENDLDKVIA